MNKGKLYRIVYACAAFVAIYAGIVLAQPDRLRYYRLNSMWKSETVGLATLRDKSAAIAAETKNQDLAFCADYLASLATAFDAVGYRNMAQIAQGKPWHGFVRGFTLGVLDPIRGLSNVGRSAMLLWNQDKYNAACGNLEASYPLVDWRLLVIAGLGALVVYFIPKWKALKQSQAAQPAVSM
jgi:hypothetical protein